MKDKARYTLLDEAIEKGKIDIAQFLISKKVEVNHLTRNGWTLLHRAAKLGVLEFVKYVVQNDKEMIDSKNSLGETPLMIAVKQKDAKQIVYFLIMARDKSGKTM